MRDKTRDQISELNPDHGAACDLHGRAWTGVPVAASEASGDYAVLQYVHPAYAKVTEGDIVAFSAEKTCCECGDPTDPLPLWVVDRILMANPYLVLDVDDDGERWEGICQECASEKSCPHCSEEEGNEDEDGNHTSTHPYCQ